MIITVEFKGQDHQVFVPDKMCTFLQNDAEQLNKYILHILENNMSKQTDKFPLQGARKSGTGSLFDITLDEDPTVDDYEDDNENLEALINTDNSVTEIPEDNTSSSPSMLVYINKTAIQCENKWKNLRKLYLKKQRNKKATSSGQCAFYFEFDRIYKEEPSFTPVALAGNLIQEESAKNDNSDDNQTEYTPPSKKRKTDSLSNMHLFLEKKKKAVEKGIKNQSSCKNNH
ncbi:trihelix transcription factor GTL2-like [Aphis craccivora]|uniref:Trihelix transcription factor GTL2-like n=1 Tax=Aphis craccivora TaxID=307492 RepID=A0A6G0ZIX8_APHCR|nr:trihelix transcription factor GTL2-like [Aphis craccivora]